VSFRSAVYEGTVTHTRMAAPRRAFTYRLAMPLLDLAEIDDVLALHPLFSRSRAAAVRYRREDFLGPHTLPLDEAIRELVCERLGFRPEGRVAMLGHLRTLGFLFNPITLYLCFDRTRPEDVVALVAEVENTPWHERTAYVMGGPGQHRLSKAMHVSPFLCPSGEYRFSFGEPAGMFYFRIDVIAPGGETVLTAALRLRRRAMNRQALGRLLLRYPLITLRVSAGIYVQAARLAARRALFHRHPGGAPPRFLGRTRTPDARLPPAPSRPRREPERSLR
jgi:DUF1365 family protein